MSLEKIVSALEPIAKSLVGMDLGSENFASDIEDLYPKEGSVMKEISELLLQGLEDGTICDRENSEVRFSRISKSTKEMHNFSIDAVYMSGPGPKHTHPKGEVSFCIATEGDPDFDGFKAGWAIYGPGSTHVPTVSGGTMLIIYFLPDGSVEWK